jgi:hypothetical protein
MTKVIHFLIFLNFSFCIGQEFEFGIINDNDGFVNVRSSKDLKNNVTDTLENGAVVSHFGAEGNWILVDYTKKGNDRDGYIYKDRIKGLTKFTKIPVTKASENSVTFSNRKISITIHKKAFDKAKHTYKYYKENPNQLYQIDGKDIFGTDGNIPKAEYRSIEIEIDSLKLSLPKKAIENLYEPNLEYTLVNYDEKSETLYIQSLNSDGAGGYALLWVIEKGKYKMRIEAIPF